MTELADLDTRIHARLSTFGCCEGYRNSGLDRAVAAVLAALSCHPRTPTGIVDGRVLAVCNTCNTPYPCMEARLIGAALGLEVA